MNRVSPEVIFLRPPERLVIEVKSSGRILRLDWQQNAQPLTMQQEFYDHYNIFVRGETTQEDLGLYEVAPAVVSFSSQRTEPAELDFVVISPGQTICCIVCMNSYYNISLLTMQLMPTQQPIMNQW